MTQTVGNVRRSKNMTSGEIRAAFLHNFRGAAYVQKFKHENINKTKSDKNAVWLEKDGKMVLVSAREMQNIEKIDTLRESMQKICEDDFKGLKDSKGRRRRFRKDFAPFSEFVLSFGTSREKNDGEALTREESEYINSRNFDENALAFIEKLRGLGYSNFQLVRHFDEKTQHYHILCLNWDFVNHRPMHMNKFQLKEHGVKLQDMMAEAFADAGVLRGQRGSRRRHLGVKLARSMRNEIREGVGEAVSSLWGSIKEKFVSYNEWKPRFLDNEPKYIYSPANIELIQREIRRALKQGYYSAWPGLEKEYKELRDFASGARKICGYDEKKPLGAVLSELRFTRTRLEISTDENRRLKSSDLASAGKTLEHENNELREVNKELASKNKELATNLKEYEAEIRRERSLKEQAEKERDATKEGLLDFAQSYAVMREKDSSLQVSTAYNIYIGNKNRNIRNNSGFSMSL